MSLEYDLENAKRKPEPSDFTRFENKFFRRFSSVLSYNKVLWLL